MNETGSWGRYPRSQTNTHPLVKLSDFKSLQPMSSSVLPYGCGRSYGDSCLNNGGTLLLTKGLNQLIHFDSDKGVLRCESGTTLAKILDFIVPKGWFLQVTPGTKHVTVGGAIANDVHDKNHHNAGTFGCHVLQLEIERSDGRRLLCSPVENADWFAATIGGLGLTGLILWAELKLKKIPSAWLEMESIPFENMSGFYDISNESNDRFEYTVAWVNSLSAGKKLGRGIFLRGNHIFPTNKRDLFPVHSLAKIALNFEPPFSLLNKFSIQCFNFTYFNNNKLSKRKKIVHYDPFFYPLDVIDKWNLLYGPKGFFQYQCMVPWKDKSVIEEILKLALKKHLFSSLTGIKTFGNTLSPGILSFPKPGITVMMDFANGGNKTMEGLEYLDEIVRRCGGRVYPAKDARMSGESFKQYYPEWGRFKNYIDPGFSSSFLRRVLG